MWVNLSLSLHVSVPVLFKASLLPVLSFFDRIILFRACRMPHLGCDRICTPGLLRPEPQRRGAVAPLRTPQSVGGGLDTLTPPHIPLHVHTHARTTSGCKHASRTCPALTAHTANMYKRQLEKKRKKTHPKKREKKIRNRKKTKKNQKLSIPSPRKSTSFVYASLVSSPPS